MLSSMRPLGLACLVWVVACPRPAEQRDAGQPPGGTSSSAPPGSLGASGSPASGSGTSGLASTSMGSPSSGAVGTSDVGASSSWPASSSSSLSLLSSSSLSASHAQGSSSASSLGVSSSTAPVASSGSNPSSGGVADAGTADGGGPVDEVLAQIPELVVCGLNAQPFVTSTEGTDDATTYHACTTPCGRWQDCARETLVRGRLQTELDFVVDEDGGGRGFGGTLRFTKVGSRAQVVLFHRGGSGTDWVDDFLPERVEAAGGTYLQPKWVQDGPGWFSRPFAGSRLQRNLHGVSLRVAAVIKWAWLNVATSPLSTVGCSGGSIATYYPRHWHGLDVVLRYQLLMGGPVMSKIEWGCRGGGPYVGRCTMAPDTECQDTAGCGPSGGTCTPYEWSGGTVMTAVRSTIDHLHAQEIGGANDCFRRRAQPAFDVSDFDSPAHPFDTANSHPINFIVNVGGLSTSDDGINVAASGAAVYSRLTGPKTWLAIPSGAHCDALNSEAAWDLLRAGVGLP